MAKRRNEKISEARLHKRMECSDAELRDLIKLASERAHVAVLRSTQLCDSTADQHAIVLHVIAALIFHAANCIRDDSGTPPADRFAFTMSNIEMLLKGYKDAAV